MALSDFGPEDSGLGLAVVVVVAAAVLVVTPVGFGAELELVIAFVGTLVGMVPSKGVARTSQFSSSPSVVSTMDEPPSVL